jgi:hypothetical protein
MRTILALAVSCAIIFGIAFLTMLLWYCFDDHLADALGAPGLGHLPWWVPLLGRTFIAGASSSSIKKD